jgi:hypothetical protein
MTKKVYQEWKFTFSKLGTIVEEWNALSDLISVAFLQARKHSILLAGRRVIWQRQGTGEADWPTTFFQPNSSKPHTKGRNTRTKVGYHESSKSLISRFSKTSRLYCSAVQCRVFCLAYCYSVEKCLKFEATFLWKFKIRVTGRFLIVPMWLKPTDYWSQDHVGFCRPKTVN